ncbi:MAG: alpha/beta hydrolase [Pseudomonadota bacterium]
MTKYFFTTRDIRTRGGRRFFGDEPAPPSFLMLPETATTMHPDDREKGAGRRRRWARAILADALAGGDPEKKDGDIVVFVHGYNNDAQDVFNNYGDLSTNLRASGLGGAVFVSYSWPAKGSFLNYLEDDSDARASAIDLVKSGLELFARLTDPDCRIRVHVMAHSMGCLVVREALRAAPGAKPTRDGAWGITQLITYGADISKRSLRQPDGEAMFAKSQRFTNYFNRQDQALATSNVKRFATAPRLGRHGAPNERLDDMVDIDVTDHWRDVADTQGLLEGIPASHNFYRRDMQFALDVAFTIKGDLDRRQIPTRTDSHEPGRMRLKRISEMN